MSILKKLLSAAFVTSSLAFALSICAQAAQIDSLTVEGGILRASLSDADGARLFVSSGNGVCSADVTDGEVELKTDITDGKIFLWDKTSLAPLSCPYSLKQSMAYAAGSDVPLPKYTSQGYTFNQTDSIVIVSSMTDKALSGFQNGEAKTFHLSDRVSFLGLSESASDIAPGSVVLLGFGSNGDIAAVELLATLGSPVSEAAMAENFGVYDPSDGSDTYQNIVAKYYGKSGAEVRVYFPPDNTKISYNFASFSTKYYSVSLSGSKDAPVVSVSEYPISDKTGIPKVADYNVYIYMRLNRETNKVTEAVFYGIKKKTGIGGGDDEYSDIFSLE